MRDSHESLAQARTSSKAGESRSVANLYLGEASPPIPRD